MLEYLLSSQYLLVAYRKGCEDCQQRGWTCIGVTGLLRCWFCTSGHRACSIPSIEKNIAGYLSFEDFNLLPIPNMDSSKGRIENEEKVVRAMRAASAKKKPCEVELMVPAICPPFQTLLEWHDWYMSTEREKRTKCIRDKDFPWTEEGNGAPSTSTTSAAAAAAAKRRPQKNARRSDAHGSSGGRRPSRSSSFEAHVVPAIVPGLPYPLPTAPTSSWTTNPLVRSIERRMHSATSPTPRDEIPERERRLEEEMLRCRKEVVEAKEKLDGRRRERISQLMLSKRIATLNCS